MPQLMTPPVWMLEHSVYLPPDENRIVVAEVEELAKDWPMYSDSHKDFLYKVFVKSGIGKDRTYLPRHIHPKHVKVPIANMATAMEEAEMVMCGVVSDVLAKTGVQAKDIDILVTCCSIFCPTPSLASMLVNKLGMRSDIQSYHLGGMGCGTGVVGVNLCRDLLAAHPNSLLLFVPAEITTYCFYPGKDKTRMVANAIFRMGGAATLMTNKPALKRACKYELVAASRMHTGADDASYNCMSWSPDPTGVNGVYLGRDVVTAASAAITAVLKDITPRIMTWGQYGEAALSLAKRRLGYEEPPYQPDYTHCCDHFALHAGGYAVLKGLQEGLRLPSSRMIPSFAGLREYGNTSCSTTWYSLAYIETCQGVKRGEKVLQLGVGGGMKAGINVWRALRDVRSEHPAWRHLAASPLTEADLPRGVDSGDIRDPRLAAIARAAEEEARRCARAAEENAAADGGH